MESERGRDLVRELRGGDSGAARAERDEKTSRKGSQLRYTLSENVIMII